MKKKIFILVALLWAITGCQKEDALTPSDVHEPVLGGYVLPQGNHAYDSKIVELSNKYKTIILYKYDEKEFWWNVTTDIRWTYDTVKKETVAGYEALPANENYVGEQVELLATEFFSHFPDTLLARTLPYKILLSSQFNSIPARLKVEIPAEKDKKLVNLYSGYDYLGVNWGNEKVLSMTKAERGAFRAEACYKFLERLFDLESLQRSASFIAVTNYTIKMTKANQYEYGIFYLNPSTTASPNVVLDWEAYMDKIVSNSYEQLIAPGGILNAAVDTKGKIRQKYTIMLDYFKTEYNIDLQGIGNKMAE